MTERLPGQPDDMTISRWRSRLKSESAFKATLEKAQARALKLVEFQQGGAHLKSSHSEIEEWYTPAEYLEASREVLGGIDLDPASSELAQATVKATRYFAVADDGLTREWPGDTFARRFADIGFLVRPI